LFVVPFSPGLPLSVWFSRCYPCRRTHARAQPCSKDFLGVELLWKYSWLLSCFPSIFVHFRHLLTPACPCTYMCPIR
jgi:hypothetical protein